ncbi:MAG: amidase [Pseudomonadota bacterium]
MNWRAITHLTAREMRRALATGELSSKDAIDAHICAVETRDPSVNAVCTRAFQRARTEADAADRARLRGEATGSLHGLPVLIKDNQLTAGITTTLGSPTRRDFVPDADAGIVARIRAAGGIVLGKTNIPEFSIGANTVNPLFGATGNPFAPDLTCGGSSGGSAVAVACEMAPLATGSDHGGSLRIPASYCGVVGFRATPGVVPNEERAITQTNYSVQGPIARNVADAALLLSVIAERSARTRRDPMAFPLDAARFAALHDIDPATLRVAVSEDLGGVLVSEGNRKQFRDKLKTIASAFAMCEATSLDISAAPDVDWHLRQDVFVTQYIDQADTWPEDFNPNVTATYDSALATPMRDIAAARRLQKELYQRTNALFDSFDLLIVPGVSVPPFPHSQLYPTVIDGRPVENYMGWLALTSSLTVVGHPVVSLPCGLDEQGTPFGIQIVGPAFGDARLLEAARAVERLLGQNEQTARPVPPLAALEAGPGPA